MEIKRPEPRGFYVRNGLRLWRREYAQEPRERHLANKSFVLNRLLWRERGIHVEVVRRRRFTERMTQHVRVALMGDGFRFMARRHGRGAGKRGLFADIPVPVRPGIAHGHSRRSHNKNDDCTYNAAKSGDATQQTSAPLQGSMESTAGRI